jgi:hypothetical protein
MQVQLDPVKPRIRIRKRKAAVRAYRRPTVDLLHATGTFHFSEDQAQPA